MSKSGNIDPYFKLSKFLSWILRHGAIEEGIPIKDDGFIHVEYILNHPFVNGKYNKEDIIHVVDTDEKCRFESRSNKLSFEIKANQGHSINVVKNLELLPINDTSGITFVIHGTFLKNWNNIKCEGLLRMGRNHIHFAQNICNTSQAISGLRKHVEIYIYIDLAKALESGLKFFVSSNGVILSPEGNMEKEQSDKRCDICEVNFTSNKSRDDHYNGKKHVHKAQLHQDIHCGVFITGFNTGQSDGVLQYFSKFGRILKTFLGPKSNYLILVYQKKVCAEAVLNKKHYFDGQMLIVEKRNQPTKLKMAPVEDSSDINSKEILKKLQGVSELNDQLKMFLQLMTPDLEQIVPNYHKVNQDLLYAMKSKFTFCEVYPFGSTTTHLQFNNSDIDIFVNIRNRPKDDEDCLRQAKKALFASNLFRNVICISSARVPIIKCVHIETDIKCDVNFLNMLGVRNSQLILYYLSLDSRLRSVMLAIKYWAKVHGIAGRNQMFTNYSMVLMFLFYLQQVYSFPSVVSLQKHTVPSDPQFIWNANISKAENESFLKELVNDTCLSILKGFFSFYSVFPYGTQIICPYLGKSVEKDLFLQNSTIPQEFGIYKMHIESIELLKSELAVCLQDPFVHNFNTCGAVFPNTLQKYIILCKFASEKILSRKDETSMLYLLFTDQPDEKLLRISHPNPNSYTVRIRMNKHSDHLRKNVTLSDNNPDFKRELLKLWFEEVHVYVHTLFEKVYKFIMNEVDNSGGNNSKNCRRDNQADVYDCTYGKKYKVISFMNLWDSRNINTSPIDDELEKCKTTLERNIVRSDYVWKSSANIRPSTPLFTCEVKFICLEDPPMVNIELIKISSYKKVYKSFCKYLLSNLSKDFDQNEIELSLK